MHHVEILPVPDIYLLQAIVDSFRPDLITYETFYRIYRKVHQSPEISGMEYETALLVSDHLQSLGFEVHTGIGGHGVAGLFTNGDGKTILMRAELNGLPILEQTLMHACGHDMNMATLLGAAALLRSAADKWSGTLVVVFQPGEEIAGGARAMVDDGLYSKVPVPDVMLAQHLVPLAAGKVAIRPGPVLAAADSANVRITGGPYPDPIAVAMRIIPRLEDAVHDEVGPDEDATVACWSFHSGISSNAFLAQVDFLLDIKTIKPSVRERALAVIEKRIRDECEAAGMPDPPIIKFSTRVPLAENDQSISRAIGQVFEGSFGSRAVEMQFGRACEDFATLGATHGVPCAYWYYGGSADTEEDAGPTNHSPFFAPVIQPTLRVGIDAMALAALTLLVEH